MKDEDRRSRDRNEDQAQASRRAGLLAQYSMAYYESDGNKKQLTKRCATTRLGPVCCLRPVCSRRIRALHQESPLDLRANTFELLFEADISWLDLSSSLAAAWSLQSLETTCIVVSELHFGACCTRPPIVSLKIGRGIHTCSNGSPGKAQLNGSKLRQQPRCLLHQLPPNQERAGTAFSRSFFT